MITHSHVSNYSHQKISCPDCSVPLRVRRRRSDGQAFLGCRNYPACRHTQPLPPGYAVHEAPDPTREAELLATIARLRQDNRNLNTALERAAEYYTKTMHELINAQMAAERKRIPAEALHRELTRLIALSHPDKWSDSPIATQLCQEVMKLRERLDRGQLCKRDPVPAHEVTLADRLEPRKGYPQCPTMASMLILTTPQPMPCTIGVLKMV
jgi:ssDNA-binding Zn-finger/Zn-ribbon topoisomerase 1